MLVVLYFEVIPCTHMGSGILKHSLYDIVVVVDKNKLLLPLQAATANISGMI